MSHWPARCGAQNMSAPLLRTFLGLDADLEQQFLLTAAENSNHEPQIVVHACDDDGMFQATVRYMHVEYFGDVCKSEKAARNSAVKRALTTIFNPCTRALACVAGEAKQFTHQSKRNDPAHYKRLLSRARDLITEAENVERLSDRVGAQEAVRSAAAYLVAALMYDIDAVPVWK